MCVCVLEVAGVSVLLRSSVCRFSAWKDGWRSTSAEELLLLTEGRDEEREGEREGGVWGWNKLLSCPDMQTSQSRITMMTS